MNQPGHAQAAPRNRPAGATMQRRGTKNGKHRQPALWVASALLGPLLTAPLFGWGGLPHQQIMDAALSAIPESDAIGARLGSEAQHLRDTVELGDWVNSLIVVRETWHVTTEDFPQTDSEYFGNDYLLFPAAPHTFSHIMPQVHDTYQPFFLRALQALRTEDPVNAVRWMGSLSHFITDSGSPAHAIGLVGPNHGKMENWLDASQLDLRGYQPRLLGDNDIQAVNGLVARMDALLARNGAIGKRMVPYAEANDRAQVEPMAMDCAAETARVMADVIHTLLVLSARKSNAGTGSVMATVTAPALAEHPLLPAKLVFLGTSYSTLSVLNDASRDRYSGTFTLNNIPAGTYRAAVERPAAATLFSTPFTIKAGTQSRFQWHLQPAAEAGNLVQNSDFALRWSTSAPDHWHHEGPCHCWLSDNIPVQAASQYRAAVLLSPSSGRAVTLVWMAQHWKPTDEPAVPVSGPVEVTAPRQAVYARFELAGDQLPYLDVQRLVLTVLPRQLSPAFRGVSGLNITSPEGAAAITRDDNPGGGATPQALSLF